MGGGPVVGSCCPVAAGDRAPGAFVRRTVIVALLIASALIAGCTAHAPPDEAVRARLRPAVEAACIAMGLPPEQRPTGRALDDQVGLLAMRLSPDRVRAVDAGTLDRTVVVEAYRATLARRDERRSRAQAPRLLVFLVTLPQWNAEQTLLAAALLAQYEHEARLEPPPPGLPP